LEFKREQTAVGAWPAAYIISSEVFFDKEVKKKMYAVLCCRSMADEMLKVFFGSRQRQVCDVFFKGERK
jgi:hypothetical protein